MTAERLLQSAFSQVSVRDNNMAVLSKTVQNRSDGDFNSFQVRTISVLFHDVQINVISYLAVIQTHGRERNECKKVGR